MTMQPGGRFRWRWRMGWFDNPMQVGNALHVLKGLSVEESLRLVCEIQDDHEGKNTDPRLIWREAKRRLRKGGT